MTTPDLSTSQQGLTPAVREVWRPFESMAEEGDREDITPPNSPRRRRRITTSGASKSIKLHSTHEDHVTSAPPPPLSYVAVQHHGKSLTASKTINEEIKETPPVDSEPLSWKNLKEENKSPKIEKFLWDANISNEIGRTDNILLKVTLGCLSVLML
jgi:hypothetical protein